MKAAQIIEYGGPSVIDIKEIDRPTPGEGQVLVEVHAASLNPFDTLVRKGLVKQMVRELPITLGGDIAGVVTSLGQGVSGLKVGDKVYGQANAVAGNSGALAEFAVTAADQVAVAPNNVDFQTAAALPLVGVSALQALTEHIKLKPGQKLLIQGGAGGIGQVAVQLAKHFGAYVATTVAATDIGFAHDLGADLVIDFSKQRFEDIVHDYDAVFNTVSGDVLGRSLAVLKRGGIAVSMTGADEAQAKNLGVTAIGQFTRVNTHKLDVLRSLVEDGTVKVRIDSTFGLDEVRDAFTKRENGARGKVVLQIR